MVLWLSRHAGRLGRHVRRSLLPVQKWLSESWVSGRRESFGLEPLVLFAVLEGMVWLVVHRFIPVFHHASSLDWVARVHPFFWWGWVPLVLFWGWIFRNIRRFARVMYPEAFGAIRYHTENQRAKLDIRIEKEVLDASMDPGKPPVRRPRL
jgi:hypothetical protein